MDIAAYLHKQKNITLSAEQRAAVEQTGGVLLLAVPGAGKTTVLTARIAHLMLKAGASPAQIRTLTFSRESARDMAARFELLFGAIIPKAPAFSTIHAFCYRLLRGRAGARLPDLLTDGKQAEIFRGLFKEATGRYGDDDLIDNIGRYHGLIRNRMETPSARHNAEFGVPGLSDLCRGYAEYKAREGLMDFDDMLSDALALLEADNGIAESLRRATPYLLIDEAQDTTALQHAIIERIATPDKLFIVGDEDQSIYGFRGTSARLMLDLPARYPGIHVLKTQETFRLAPGTCEAAGRLISLCGDRFDKKMTTAQPEGADIDFMPIEAGQTQGELIAARIAALPPGDTAAILYRNNPSAFGMADALDRAGLDFYIKEQKIRITKMGIVADILAFFALSADAGDLDAFGRIYYKMGAYISRQMLDYAMAHTPPGGNVFDALCDAPVENMSTARILYAKNQVARLATLPTPRAIDKIIGDLGYLDFLTGRAGGGVRLEQDAQLIDALLAMALRYPQVPAFLDRLDQIDSLMADHAGDRHRAALTLSTVHSAKGMEFDHVYIVDFLDGVLPSANALEEADSGNPAPLDEEIRLGYVAVTRPRRTLTLACPTAIGDRHLTPSRFIPLLLGQTAETTGPAHPLAGGLIEHRFFGRGEIISVNEAGQSLTVNFGKLGIKTLHLSILDNRKVVKML